MHRTLNLGFVEQKFLLLHLETQSKRRRYNKSQLHASTDAKRSHACIHHVCVFFSVQKNSFSRQTPEGLRESGKCTFSPIRFASGIRRTVPANALRLTHPVSRWSVCMHGRHSFYFYSNNKKILNLSSPPQHDRAASGDLTVSSTFIYIR